MVVINLMLLIYKILAMPILKYLEIFYMPGMLMQILQIIVTLVPLLLQAEGANNDAEKKASVLKELEDILDGPNGPTWPKFLPKDFRDWLLSLLVDAVINMLDKSGFLHKSTPTSPAS